MTTVHRNNPYPGLRPFRADETHLFFGRDEQRSELLGRLRRSRFLSVVGTSGSGKSSLVRAGLLPGLYGGFMAGSGSRWRIADLRPGSDPIGNLARALDKKGVLRDVALGEEELSFTEAILRRSAFGLAEVVRRARLEEDARLLVLVDQFEELFRLMATVNVYETHDDASAFIKLLLEACHQTEMPIYVVLTMRSDFLGDCARFRDLPEAINNGQYLIPRMSRTQLREAIEGPAAVHSASLSTTLVNRLLNDVGDDPDQLPILQHALMRTWDHWKERNPESHAVDLKDYEDREVGGMAGALSRHADSVLAELNKDGDEKECSRRLHIAEHLFKCLSEKTAGGQGIRRLAKLQDIADVAGVNSDEVISIIDVFRRPENSFLMPPIGEALTPETYVDISHESLIRNWGRLRRWVDDEDGSARTYRRLAQTATLYRAGKEDLLAEQALGAALKWKDKQQPTPAWAKRYDPAFNTAMDFLTESAVEVQKIEENKVRKRKVRQTIRIGALLSLLTVAFVSYFYAQYRFEKAAKKIQRRTEELGRLSDDRKLLGVLYNTYAANDKIDVPQEETSSKEKKKSRREANTFVSAINFQIATKLWDSKELSREDKLLCLLYHMLETGQLWLAQKKFEDLKKYPYSSHFAAAKLQWESWGETKAKKWDEEASGSIDPPNMPLGPEYRLLNRIRDYLRRDRKEDAQRVYDELKSKYPYTVYRLLADAALNAANPPLKGVAKRVWQSKIVQEIIKWWPLIVLLAIWPTWHLWEWIRRLLWKDAKIKAKPHLIPRALAAATDLVVAVALSLLVGGFLGSISAILGALVSGKYTSSGVEDFYLWTFAIVSAVTFSAYMLFRDAIEYRYRRSIGKILFRLRPIPVGADNEAMSMKISAKRNFILLCLPVVLVLFIILSVAFKTFFIAVLGLLLVPLFLILEIILSAVKEGRTLHDRIGGTRIIDIRSKAL